MDEFAGALEATSVATYLRQSRWGYAVVNTLHIFGFALLIGAIVALDLRLLGFWRRFALGALARHLVPVAALGLATAMLAGAILFAVGARDYVDLMLFRIKIGLVLIGILSALATHMRYGLWLERSNPPRLAGAISLVCWIGALIAGRMIAFVAG